MAEQGQTLEALGEARKLLVREWMAMVLSGLLSSFCTVFYLIIFVCSDVTMTTIQHGANHTVSSIQEWKSRHDDDNFRMEMDHSACSFDVY